MREKSGEQRKRSSVSGFYPRSIRGVKSDRLLVVLDHRWFGSYDLYAEHHASILMDQDVAVHDIEAGKIDKPATHFEITWDRYLLPVFIYRVRRGWHCKDVVPHPWSLRSFLLLGTGLPTGRLRRINETLVIVFLGVLVENVLLQLSSIRGLKCFVRIKEFRDLKRVNMYMKRMVNWLI